MVHNSVHVLGRNVDRDVEIAVVRCEASHCRTKNFKENIGAAALLQCRLQLVFVAVSQQHLFCGDGSMRHPQLNLFSNSVCANQADPQRCLLFKKYDCFRFGLCCSSLRDLWRCCLAASATASATASNGGRLQWPFLRVR